LRPVPPGPAIIELAGRRVKDACGAAWRRPGPAGLVLDPPPGPHETRHLSGETSR